MTDSESKVNLIAIVISIIFGFLCGLWSAHSSWTQECVRRGVAEYNQTTGEWQWKVSPLVEVLPGEDPQKREAIFQK